MASGSLIRIPGDEELPWVCNVCKGTYRATMHRQYHVLDRCPLCGALAVTEERLSQTLTSAEALKLVVIAYQDGLLSDEAFLPQLSSHLKTLISTWR